VLSPPTKSHANQASCLFEKGTPAARPVRKAQGLLEIDGAAEELPVNRHRLTPSRGDSKMKKLLAVLPTLALVLAFAQPAEAQSGHFNDRSIRCSESGDTITCTGKVAGLGGETFEILLSANGTAEIECTNPGGNVAPGQDADITAEGSSGPLLTPQNGNYNFSVFTLDPADPQPGEPNFTCPNNSWTANIVSVDFTSCTLELYEDGNLSDTASCSI
jgi:hypothetical protein